MLRCLFHRMAVAAGIVALTTATPVLAQEGQKPEGEPIKIGSFLAVTGPASFLGAPEQKTLELYIDKLNDSGGLLGRPVKLISYDAGGDAGEARTLAKRLISADQVDVIIGGSTSGATLAVIPLVQRAQIPFISLAGSIKIVEPVKEWVFKTPHTDRMAVRKVFTDMQKRGYDQIGLISGTGGFGSSCREQALANAEEFGIEIVADERYGASDTDMTAQLTNIRNTEGLDAVLNCGFGQGPAIVTKNYRQLGIDVPLYQSHGVASKSYIELAGGAANGVILPAAALLVAEQLPEDDPQKPVVMSYKQTYEETFNQPVSTFGGHAYDALKIYVDAVERAGTTDPEAVRKAIEQTSNLMGTGGEFNLSPEDHLGLDLSAFRMLEIVDGDWKLLY